MLQHLPAYRRYISIVMTRYKIIVCQGESCKYFDAEFWEADVSAIPPKKHYKICPQMGLRWGEEIFCKLSNLVLSKKKEMPKSFLPNP